MPEEETPATEPVPEHATEPEPAVRVPRELSEAMRKGQDFVSHHVPEPDPSDMSIQAMLGPEGGEAPTPPPEPTPAPPADNGSGT